MINGGVKMLNTDYNKFLNTEINFTYLSSYSTFSKKEIVKNHYICHKGMRKTSRLFFVLDGETAFSFRNQSGDEKNVTASTNDIVYLPPDIEYTSVWDDSKPIEYVSIEFSAETVSREEILLNDEIFVIAHDKHDIFKTSFLSLYNTYTSSDINHKFKCRSIFYDILANIATEKIRANYKKIDHSVYKSIFFLENNYLENISVSELAKMSNICESSYRLKFKKIKGMSPIDYKNFLRVKKGAELLHSNKYTVTEVAELVNIPDICYFNKLFKKYYKTTPSMYQKENHI